MVFLTVSEYETNNYSEYLGMSTKLNKQYH